MTFRVITVRFRRQATHTYLGIHRVWVDVFVPSQGISVAKWYVRGMASIEQGTQGEDARPATLHVMGHVSLHPRDAYRQVGESKAWVVFSFQMLLQGESDLYYARVRYLSIKERDQGYFGDVFQGSV